MKQRGHRRQWWAGAACGALILSAAGCSSSQMGKIAEQIGATAQGVITAGTAPDATGQGELGFVMASRLWGRGLFPEAARLVLDFAFRVVKVHRIEARSAVDNARGNAALQKLGASREGRLRAAFLRDDHYVDQYLWSILDTDWWADNAQQSDR